MSGSLENRSSLRKLEFPNCTLEALKRLLNTCVTVSHKLPTLDGKTNPAAFLVLSPKETELVLEIIDEFVFFTKPSLSKSRRLTSQVQELQLLQIIIEFYRDTLPEVSESLSLDEKTGPLLLLTNYLFMENDQKEDKRSMLRCRFTILALSLKNRPVLHCIGLWLLQQQCSNALALQLSEGIISHYVNLVSDAQESLNNMPNISPVFAVGLMTCLTELYNSVEKWPCLALVEISTKWMKAKEEMSGILGPGLLLGLVRWTVLHPFTPSKGKSSGEDATYAHLHLAILEALAENQKSFTIPNKSIVLFLARIDEALKKASPQCDLGSSRELALDRLGQFLHCLSATGCVQGKQNEVCNTIKKSFADNRLLQMYLNRYQ